MRTVRRAASSGLQTVHRCGWGGLGPTVRGAQLFDGGADSDGDGGGRITRLCLGDVVVLSDGTLGVVAEPGRGAGLVTCLELDDLGNLPRSGRDPEILIASRDSIHRVVGCRSELGEEIRHAIAWFRSQPADAPDGTLDG